MAGLVQVGCDRLDDALVNREESMAWNDAGRTEVGRSTWLWGIVGLAALILVLVWMWPDVDEAGYAETERVEEVTPATTPEPTQPEGALGPAAPRLALEQVLADPEQYVGTTFSDTEMRAVEVPTDRGFWIEENGNRLFAVIIDRPAEEPKDINPGATLRVEHGTFRDPSYLPRLQGAPLDEDTRRIAEDQPILLVVDERNIEVRQAGEPQPGTDPAEGVGG